MSTVIRNMVRGSCPAPDCEVPLSSSRVAVGGVESRPHTEGCYEYVECHFQQKRLCFQIVGVLRV
jgi:hypothetical protein